MLLALSGWKQEWAYQAFKKKGAKKKYLKQFNDITDSC